MSNNINVTPNDLRVVYNVTKLNFTIGEKITSRTLADAGHFPVYRYRLSAALRLLCKRGMFKNIDPNKKTNNSFEYIKLIDETEVEYGGQVQKLQERGINSKTKKNNMYTVVYQKTILVTKEGFTNIMNDKEIEIISFKQW